MPRKVKRRIQPSDIIDKLQAELDKRQAELQEETARNARARTHVALLKAVAATAAAMRARGLLPAAAKDEGGAPAGAEAACSVDAAAAELAAVLRAASRGGGSAAGAGPSSGEATNTSGGSGGGGGSGGARSEPPGASEPSAMNGADQRDGSAHGPSSGSEPTANSVAGQQGGPVESAEEEHEVGAVGASTSAFIDSAAAIKEAGITKDEFVAWWRGAVFDLAVLLRQSAEDAGARDRLARTLREMGAHTIGLVQGRGHLWFFELFNTDMGTLAPAVPPPRVWARTAEGMRLSPQQDLLFELVSNWWDGHCDAITQRREELAAIALEAPDDVALQAEIAEELERTLGLYNALLSPVMVLINTVFLRPEQMAEYYVQPWPWMPVLTPFFDALGRLRAGRSAGALDSLKSQAAGGPGACEEGFGAWEDGEEREGDER